MEIYKNIILTILLLPIGCDDDKNDLFNEKINNSEVLIGYGIGEFIFTGLQILDQSVFSSIKEKKFSMNKIWDSLIKKNSLIGKVSKQKFYHLNTKESYNKILSLKITD